MSSAHNEWDPQYIVTDFETASIEALYISILHKLDK